MQLSQQMTASQQSHQYPQPSSQQPFSMSQPSSQTLNLQSSYRQYTDPAPQPAEHVMPIYSALYSGVGVYETEANGITVMRRQSDGWLNATQILKVAGVEKGRRTKILEKEIQTGEHEKVQGGYGKYQGTWIPFERGLEVCRQYGVHEVLHALLTHKRGQDGGSAPDVDTPTKEQAMAAQRKRLYNASSQESRGGGVQQGGTFFKSISSTASHAINAISKARFESPAPRNRNPPSRAPSFQRQPSMQDAGDFPPNSQHSFVSNYGAPESAFGSQETQPVVNETVEPARKRQRILTPAHSFGGLTPTYPSMNPYAENFPGSPTEPNESFIYSRNEPEYAPGPLRPLPYETAPEAEAKRSMLMQLFLNTAGPDENQKSILRNMIPQELDGPIDAQSNTALIWAATLARMPLLRALVEAGSSPFRVNASGETALMRACNATNSMEHGCFPDLLDILGGTLDVRDDKGRTVLHHIALVSAVQGRNVCTRYYLESLLEWVVRQGSNPSSQSQTYGSNGLASSRMNIGRFMGEIVNAQDNRGDTALNVAARVGNRSIISQLIEVGADPEIANTAGLRPLDFGIGLADGHSASGETGERNAPQGSRQKSRENSDEVVNSISHLINESTSQFQGELKKKQDAIDALHGSLRTTSAQVGEARRNLEALQEKLTAQQLARQKASNLALACEEEEMGLRQLVQQHRVSVDNLGPEQDWAAELRAVLTEAKQQAADDTGVDGHLAADADKPHPAARLPSAAVLRARIRAVHARGEQTRHMVGRLKARSKQRELQYRKLVSLCTRRPEAEVDRLLETLTKAVESEKGELELGRVRRFLGGVEGVVA
ncbi:transcriptional regulator swi6 [Podospora pseudocomata]|uniref:Transcriptional regulator swi6 n=1 Tax=Podospora pseudocomata TaxID=2093779 RepID=A0ABR0GHH0_9PEZI|nr:transcriptional regulator swi6 [Podospora pseudocomata]